MQMIEGPRGGGAKYPEVWARVAESRPRGAARPIDVPRPESVDEVTVWAGSEDSRRVQLIYAPIFWVVLPLAAFGLLIQQAITDPTGEHVNIVIEDQSVESWPVWLLWIFWGGASIWLLIAVGVLVVHLSIFRGLHAENEWIFTHSVAYSIHRASVDYDDGESSGWATYIALDHRLDRRQAARIHEAFEQWLRVAGLPPSGSGPISSEALFGASAKGGYFILHLPISQTAGARVENQWILITEPRDTDDGDEVIVTPVPTPKKLQGIRARLHRKAARRGSRRVPLR
ncbi:hypothetical protein GCM10025768_24830 [Microbacterium pseudoresistens]|uniref:Uncharacterized protein n=1 Tax=Microbacterium pseudoresistens TaxID=640634 RepID=A0A7Y9EWN4_9MICO|nr:hypothetical protein [Microbacterium pseudoresistens]NYD55308.1 hypothetical protein [Microbacterium pseudoresistens]